MTIAGLVERSLVCQGFKSEREAIVIRPQNYILRSIGNPFNDPEWINSLVSI